MSKLDELIKEYCPDGVEYKTLDEIIVSITSPTKLKKELYQKNGKIPIIDQGINFIAGYTDKQFETVKEGKYIIFGDHSEHIKYIDFTFIQGADGLKILKSVADNPKYIYYAFINFYKKEMNYKRHWSKAKDTIIPIPPLPVQEEIVRILDNFTELTAELTEELTARKKQYEYYREMLIYNRSYISCTLDSIGEFIRGKRFIRTDIVKSGIPCMHYGDIYIKYGMVTDSTDTFLNIDKTQNMRYADKGDIIIVQAGENEFDLGVGVVWESEQKVAVHDACYIFKSKQNSRYISHYLRTYPYHKHLLKYVSNGKISSVNSIGIGKMLIPLPSLEEQQRIVDILDRFDTLCNDISEGLPAEIKMREHQYEYYRDKLLNFKNINDL